MTKEEKSLVKVIEQSQNILCPKCGSDDNQYQATQYLDAKSSTMQECHKCLDCGHKWNS